MSVPAGGCDVRADLRDTYPQATGEEDTIGVVNAERPVSGDQPAPYYAQAFAAMPGRCFQLVSRGAEGGGPIHCTEPPTWRGSFRAPNGRRYTVEACEGHRPPAEAGR
jgi:hypothetical protein